MDVREWYTVEFDADNIRLKANPPGGQPWSQELRWADIDRVCFVAEDFTVSDGIYLFTNQRPESYAIPVEAQGGQRLWGEIIERGLFDAALAVHAATSTGGVFCWPPPEPASDDQDPEE